MSLKERRVRISEDPDVQNAREARSRSRKPFHYRRAKSQEIRGARDRSLSEDKPRKRQRSLVSLVRTGSRSSVRNLVRLFENRLMTEGRKSQIVLPDERRLDIIIQPKLFSCELLDLVASHFRLKEKQYFGLAFIDDTHHFNWLTLEKRVLDHDFPKRSGPLTLHFSIRYYIETIGLLRDSATVEIFYLHARQAIFGAAMLKAVCQRVRKEVDQSSRHSIMQSGKYIDPTCFSFESIWQQLKVSLPTLNLLLESCAVKSTKTKPNQTELPSLCMAASVLLFSNCPKLSRMQYINGLILDQCGATKECLAIFNKIGVSMSYESIRKKKKSLQLIQEQAVCDKLLRYKQYMMKDTSLIKNESVKKAIPTTSHSVASDDDGYESKLLDGSFNMSDDVMQDISIMPDSPTSPPAIEIIGDNVDLLVSPGTLTKDRQRQSLHWFLTMVTQKRIVDTSLSCKAPKDDITKIDCAAFIPTKTQVTSLHEDFIFHTTQVLLKYIPCLKSMVKDFPKFIVHDHMEQAAERSNFLVAKLIDASENSNDGMIKILTDVHKTAVPHTGEGIAQRVVFGGDVLTNERAFKSQRAVQNGSSKVASLMGLIHRPEGLHREMNFLQTLYQLFYNEKSSHDDGSLLALRNSLHRKDVVGPDKITVNFRAHFNFLQDVIDGLLVAQFLNLNDMDKCDSDVKLPHLFSLKTADEKRSWLLQQAEKVLSQLEIFNTEDIDLLRNNMEAIDNDEKDIQQMHNGRNYDCPQCNKRYIRKSSFVEHLKTNHRWTFSEIEDSYPSKLTPLQCMLQMGLLLRDTHDAYRMGDGNRIVRNATFEWLYAGANKHFKYRLWLWRFLAYDKAILSPREAFEYRWNCCVNTIGGTGNNIPNDNLVEIHVHKLKSQLQTQGPNKTFASAETIAMTTQVLDTMKTTMKSACQVSKRTGKRSQSDQKNDIISIVETIRSSVSDINQISWNGFGNFKPPLQKLNSHDLHDWIEEQKAIAGVLM